MKTLTTILTIFMVFISVQTKAQTYKRAVDYLDFVGKELNLITKNNWRYTKAIAHSRNDKAIRTKRNNLVKSVERALKKIEKANGYDGDEFKNQVLTLMRLNENMLNQDYAKIVDMKEVANQSYDLMEAYILAREMANKKMTEAQEDYEKHLHAFADKHNINIIDGESDLANKMKISNAVFEHYNDMYLIQFKVQINEIYLWESINNKDISAIQQHMNTLKETASQGLEDIKIVSLYKDDNALVEATKDMFSFYINETENYIPQIIDFFILNEDVENIQKSLDKTPEKDRTKKQVNNYNAKIDAINKAVDNYNKINAKLNNTRQKATDKLNSTNQNFLDKHIPND